MNVTQADRNRATSLRTDMSPEILRGNCDHWPLVQAFAAHRIAALEEAKAVAKAHQPKRLQQGRTLAGYDQEEKDIIRSEENGELIAASIIAAAISALIEGQQP